MTADGYDVLVTGSWGLYEITPAGSAARRWVKKHLSKGERTVRSNGAVMCEGGREIRHIVAGMVKDGLRVSVNGQDMAGFAVRP